MVKRGAMEVSKSSPQWVISEIFTEAGNLGTRIRRGLQNDHLHVNVSLMPHAKHDSCPFLSMDRIPCYERGDGGSIPSRGASISLFRCGHVVMVATQIVTLLVRVQLPVVTPK